MPKTTPEQQELTQRIRRRAFRLRAPKLLQLADEVATMRFPQPPRVLLEQFRDEDPFMADIDLAPERMKPRPARPPKRETVYEATVGNRRLTIERVRGELTVRLAAGDAESVMPLDEVQERRLRKAFAIHPQPTWQERQNK